MRVLILTILAVILMSGVGGATTIIQDFEFPDSTSFPVGWNQSATNGFGINDSKGFINVNNRRAIYDAYGSYNISVDLSQGDGNFSNSNTQISIYFNRQTYTTDAYTQGYALNIVPISCQIQLLFHNGSASTTLQTLSTACVNNSDTILVNASSVDDGLQIYKNGTLFKTFTTTNSSYSQGYSGLGTGTSYTAGEELQFDNYILDGVINLLPEITSWNNNITSDTSLNFNVLANESINLSITALYADYYDWYVDGVNQSRNATDFNTSWASLGSKTVTAYANNTNGSDSITWGIGVTSGIGTTWYVSPTGNNSLDGLTISTAKKNFSNTEWFNSSNVLPGDTVLIIDGTYTNESIYFTSINGNTIYVSGSSEDNITIKAYNGTPTFDGVDSQATAHYGIFADSNNYPFSVQNVNISGLKFVNWRWGSLLRRTTNFILDNNNFSNMGESMGSFPDNYNLILQNNEFGNMIGYTTPPASDCSCNTIQIKAGNYYTENVSIINNTFHDNNFHGFIDLFNYNTANDYNVRNINISGNRFYNSDAYQALFQHNTTVGASWIIDNVTFQNNVVNNVSNGIKIDHLFNSTIRDNIFYDNPVSSITYTNPQFYWAQNNIITNNSGWNAGASSGASSIFLGMGSQGTGIQIVDNNTMPGYTVVGAGTLIVQDPLVNTSNTSFLIKTYSASTSITMILRYTDNKIFNENGSNLSYFYPDRSEYIINNLEETVEVTPSNITLRPSQNNFTASNTTSAILINETSQNSGNINIMIGSDILENKTLNISYIPNTITNVSLRYAGNLSIIESVIPSVGIANFSSVNSGSYILTDETQPATPSTPASSDDGWDSDTTAIDTFSSVGKLLLVLIIIAVFAIMLSTLNGIYENKTIDPFILVMAAIVIMVVFIIYQLISIIGASIAQI